MLRYACCVIPQARQACKARFQPTLTAGQTSKFVEQVRLWPKPHRSPAFERRQPFENSGWLDSIHGPQSRQFVGFSDLLDPARHRPVAPVHPVRLRTRDKLAQEAAIHRAKSGLSGGYAALPSNPS